MSSRIIEHYYFHFENPVPIRRPTINDQFIKHRKIALSCCKTLKNLRQIVLSLDSQWSHLDSLDFDDQNEREKKF